MARNGLAKAQEVRLRQANSTGREGSLRYRFLNGSRVIFFRIYFSGPRWSESFSIGSVIVDLAVGSNSGLRRSRFAPALEECLTTVGVNRISCVPAIRDVLRALSAVSGDHRRECEAVPFERCFSVVALDSVSILAFLSLGHQMEGTYRMCGMSNLGWGEGTDEIPHVIR